MYYNSGKGDELSKKNKQHLLWVGLVFVLVAMVLIVIVVVNVMKGKEAGDIKVGEETEVMGLVCKDTALIHPALISKRMKDHMNTITANFRDDKLSSISLVYEGDYGAEQMAKEAEAFARAEYNLTLINKYGEKDDIFSIGFSVDGAKMQMVQTARDISKINTNTVTYFLLDQGTSIVKTMDGLKKQYEANGFSCKESD